MSKEKYFTLNGAAAELGLNRKTVLKMIHEGKFPNIVRGGSDGPRSPWRIPASDVAAHRKPVAS